MATYALDKQGESITFVGDADPSAASVEFEVQMAPGASGPSPHIHSKQSVAFTVVSGRLLVTVNGSSRYVDAGETAVVRPGEVHSLANADASTALVFRCKVEPALQFQWFLSESARSAIRAGGSWDDMSLLEAGYILRQMGDEYRLAGIPAVVQDAAFALLSGVARVLGRTWAIAPRPGAVSRERAVTENP